MCIFWPIPIIDSGFKGVTKQLLWQEYRQQHPDNGYSYAQFCHRYLEWLGRQQRSMRQTHRAGEKLFVDYCAPTMPVVNPDTGEIRRAQIFVAVLGASNYTFACASWSQAQADCLRAHVQAFEFFGGVPEVKASWHSQETRKGNFSRSLTDGIAMAEKMIEPP